MIENVAETEEIKEEKGNESELEQQVDDSGEEDLKAEKAAEKIIYQTGGQKIKAEAEDQYEKAKEKESEEMMKAQMAPIIEYITQKCEDDSEYNALVLQDHKTWENCYEFMMDKAQKMAASGSTGILVEGSTILKWIDEYYHLDDKAQAEKKAAEKAAKGCSGKKLPQKPMQHKTKAADKPEVPVDKQKVGKKKNEMDGQFSLFDM